MAQFRIPADDPNAAPGPRSGRRIGVARARATPSCLRSRAARRALRRRCGRSDVSAGPAVVRRQRARAGDLPLRELQLTQRPDARRISCCGAMRARTMASPMLLSADIAESVGEAASACMCLRSKVAVADVSSETQRVGVGGPGGGRDRARRFESVPELLEARHAGVRYAPGLAGAALSSCWRPRATPSRCAHASRGLATPAGFDAWRWLTIRRGCR